MHRITVVLIGLWITMIIAVSIGCSSSKESYGEQENQMPPPTPKEKLELPPKSTPSEKVDTLSVNPQNTEKPSYESKTVPKTTVEAAPKGKFAVQIGAYQMAENAERIASLARERFVGKTVYTIEDKADNLYKVMIGDFMTRDEARTFRDTMARHYYSEYKDAWVAEIPRNE